MDLAARRLLAVLLALVALMTLSGYLLKAQCIGDYNQVRDEKLCSNDIQVLYLIRDLHAHQFPYIHGSLVKVHNSDGTTTDTLVGGTLEYPVLTGLFAWFPALFVHNDGGYLQLTALLLTPFTFITVALLARMVRWRALLYAVAPPLIWYSFHNWDLLVVCATTAAFYAWWKQRYLWCGAWLAVGTWLKLWPLFFLLPLLLERLHAKDKVTSGQVLGVFAGLSVVINGFFLAASPRGWWAPYAFQQDRAADITSNSIWYWGFAHPVSTATLNRVVPALLLLGIAICCSVGWWRAQREGSYPFIQVCGAILCVFMVTNKANSPQYALWLLPFFCLIRVRWGWWATYMIIDICLYVGLFRWYYALETPGQPQYARPYEALIIGIWGRTAMLLLLIVVFLRSRTSLVAVPDRQQDPLPTHAVPV